MSIDVKTRIKQKTDTSTNWAKATNFIPLKGEIIVYSDLKKIKIGDGTTKVNDLAFAMIPSISDIDGLSDELNKKFDKTGGTISGATTVEVKTDSGSLLTLHRIGVDPDAGESTFTIDSYGADGGSRSVGFNAQDAFFYYKREGKTIAFPQTTRTGGMYDDRLLLESEALSNFAKLSHTHTISDITNLQTALNTYTSDISTLKAKPGLDKVGTVTSVTIKKDGSTRGTITTSGTIDLGYQSEAYLQWGGKNFSGSYGPIDAAMIGDLGADRFAFIPASQWTVEYSRDGGATWVDYGATDTQKKAITGQGTTLVIGKADSSNLATEKYMLRLTLLTSGAVYSQLNKFAIYLSTNGSNGCYCTIQSRTKANVDAGNDTWVTRADKVPVSGWSGWNIINTSDITTHGNSANQYANIRFIFGCTSGSTKYAGLQVNKIKAFGGVGWQTSSTMAATGHLYKYDSSQNATFPANVNAVSLSENNTLISSIYAKKTSFSSITASKATAGTARSIGNANVGSAVKVLTGASGTFVNSSTFKDVYTENTQTLELQFGTTTASVSTSTTNITPAASSGDKITPYAFTDVSASKLN